MLSQCYLCIRSYFNQNNSFYSTMVYVSLRYAEMAINEGRWCQSCDAFICEALLTLVVETWEPSPAGRGAGKGDLRVGVEPACAEPTWAAVDAVHWFRNWAWQSGAGEEALWATPRAHAACQGAVPWRTLCTNRPPSFLVSSKSKGAESGFTQRASLVT